MTEEEKKRLRKALASEQAAGRKVETTTALRERFEASQPKVAAVGGISEGSEYNRGSISALRSNYSRFEQEQPEAAAILKQLAEERAAREQKEQRSADMLFGVGAIRTPDGLQKRMEAQLMAEVPGGTSPFTSVDMDLAERSAMQRAINARANSMPHSVDTEYSIVEGAALDRDKIAAYQQMLQAPVVEESTEELSLWEKIKGRPEAQSDATKLALASYAANVGEAAASVEEASPLRYAEDLPSVFGAQVDDFRANTVDKLAEEVQANIAKGTYSELENQLTDVGIRAGLDTLVMLASGGGAAAVQTAGGMGFVTNMARNPMFWTSFVQEYGSLYDEMTKNGTDPQKAASVAAMAAATNSALEVGGGTEKMVSHLTGRLPAKKGWDLAKAVAQNSMEEALEETMQSPVSNLAAKMTYDPYREVIDPEEIAKNAGMAFLVGGILGGAGYGGQAAVEKVGDAVYRRAETGLIGEMARETDGGAGMIRAAKESDIPELMELANEYEAQLRRGKALSDRQLAELYRAEESLDVIPKSATTEATTEARKATTEAITEEGQRTNVRASEPLYGSGEEFAAEEEKTAPAPRSVELGKAEANISSVRRADEAVKSFAQSLGEHGKAAFLAAEEVSGEADGGRFAWQTYYNAGKWGKDMAWADQQNPAARALLVGDLTAEQAFKAGQMDAAEEMQSRAKKVSQKGPGLVLGSGTAHVAPEVRSALDSIAKAFDAQIELMDMGDSQVRGAYNPSTGTIQLNTRTGFQGVMINVAKHEITHKLQDEAPEEYAAFKNYAASVIYERDGIAFEDLVQEQIDLYAERGIQISRSEAEDEVVANATEAFLRDEESIRKLCEKDRSLGQKILDAIRDVIRKIQKVLKGGELEQEAARLLSEDVESLKKAEELWLKALAESKEAVKAKQGGDAVTEAVENGQMGILPGAEMVGGHLRYNLQTTTEDDMKRYRQMLAGTGMSEAEMSDLFGFFSEIRGIIEAHKDILDFEVDLEKEKFRPVKPNSDPLYKVSVDFSTLCRKRLLTQTITERLQKQLKRPLSKEEQLEIRNRLVSLRKELEQIDVACGLCYVESRRLLSAKQIGAFFADPEKELRKFFGSKDKDIRRKVNEEAKRMIEEKGASSLRELARMSKDAADEVRAWKRAALASYRSDDSDVQAELEYAIDLAKNHREVFLSAQSLHDLMDEHPMVYDAFTTYVRNATKSKAQETRVPWRVGDSQKISDALIRRMNAENGLRMQSWSDYEVVNTLDYMTAMMELSARGAKVQTYTKVPDFVRLMGRTGAMINLSLIAKGDGVDADGNLLFDGREGMGIEDAEKLRLEYPGTAGTIIVGISDEHILAALKDDRIDYVIPYHASGMSKEMRSRAGIMHWTDYESSQSEKGKGKAPSFSEWAKPGKGDNLTDGAAFMKKASERYLKLCHERGLTPKFSQFLQNNGDGSYSLRSDAENYWKLLIDRKMVDSVTGGYIEQQAVRPVFDEQAVKDILGRELVSEAAKQNAKAADIVVDEFLRGEIEVSDETIETVRQMEDSHLRYGIEEAMKDETEKTAPPEESGVRYQLAVDRYKGKSLSEDSSVYDYDFLVSLPDMQVTVLPETASELRGEDGRISAGEVVKEGMKNARTVGTERDGKIYVKNSYTGRELMITASSVRHGLNGDMNRMLTNSRLGAVIGEVVKNAVPVNGLYNKAEGVTGTYAMAAYAADNQGREFVAIVTVEQWSGDVAGVEVYDVTHSLSGRQKKRDKRLDTKSQGFYPYTNASVISIADFLGIVNSTHQSVLSDDVLEHLGEERNPAGYYSDRVKFQLTPEARERGRLIRENERLKKANAHLREGFKLTKGVEVSEADVEALAKKILKRYSSDADAGMLAEALRKVYRYIGNDAEPNWETVNEVLSAAAGKVLEDSREFDRSFWEETAEMRKRIRETPVYVAEDQRGDFARAEGYQAFKRSHSRMFKIVNDPTAMSVDQFYAELAEDYPYLLDGEATSAYDQLQEIADFIEASKPRWQNPFGENLEEMAAELVGEMYDAYFDLPQVKTFADKKKAEIDALRMKHRAAMQELKEAERKKREELLGEAKRKYEEDLRKAKLEGEQALLTFKAKAAVREGRRINLLKREQRLIRQRASERRHLTEMRRKIERKVKALSRMVINPTDKQNVPEGLRNAVKQLIESLDLTGARGEDTNVSQKWSALKAALSAAAPDSDTSYGVIIDPELGERLVYLSGQNVHLNNMTREQAEELYKALAALEGACRGVHIEDAKGRKIAASEVSHGMVEEMSTMREIPVSSKRGYDLHDPRRFFDKFGSGMRGVFDLLTAAQDKSIRLEHEALQHTEKIFGRQKILKWKNAKAQEFTTEGGGKIELTPAQVMELYVLSKREQGQKHIYAGGIRTDEARERVSLTPVDVGNIVSSLSAEQKKVADQMAEFLSNGVSEWGNEVSLELYRYKKFTEKHYWPIRTDSDYTAAQSYAETPDAQLKTLGMTKATNPNASNAVIIGNVFDTYARHISQMIAYSAYVPVLEQVETIYKWQTSHDGNIRSVRASIRRVGGKKANAYMEQLLRDLNGAGRTSRSFGEKMMGLIKRASIAGNVRVWVQQPTAYLRAAAEVNPAYLLKGLIPAKGTSEEMKTYAPIARWKDWGYYDIGTGRELGELMTGGNLRDKALNATMAMAGVLDNATWGAIWNAVKAETAAKTKYEPGSEEFLQEAGRRFREVVDRTQVVDSVLHRTQIMRSGNAMTKMSTAFMGEPLKSLNMVMGAADRIRQAQGKEKWKAAGGFVRSCVTFMATAMLNALVTAFVDAERDDDDDETYWQKWRQALLSLDGDTKREQLRSVLGSNIVENVNPLNLIPYVKDVFSLMQGYDVERMDMQGISDVMDDMIRWVEWFSKGEAKYTAKFMILDTGSSIAKTFGIPLSNIVREVTSLVNLGLTLMDDYGLDTTELRYRYSRQQLDIEHSANKGTFISFMLEARMAGDTELATEIFNDLIDAGYTNEKIESAMASQAKKMLKKGFLAELEKYNAALATGDAAKVDAIADELLKEGYRPDEIIGAAKNLRNSSEEEEEIFEHIEETFWDEYGEEDLVFGAAFAAEALVEGSRASLKTAEQEMLDAGYTQKEVDSKVKSALKTRILEEMGYEKISDMEEDGEVLDMSTEEYRILKKEYGYTQFSSSHAARALMGDLKVGYQKVKQDMIGTKTDAGVTIDEEWVDTQAKSTLMSWYKKGRYERTATSKELSKYKSALVKLGITSSEVEEAYEKYARKKDEK